MAGPSDKERGLRTQTRARVGLDFDHFHGMNVERDAGSVPPSDFVSLVNADNDGKKVTERPGLTKTVAAMFAGGAIKGVWDLESDLESPVAPPAPAVSGRYFDGGRFPSTSAIFDVSDLTSAAYTVPLHPTTTDPVEGYLPLQVGDDVIVPSRRSSFYNVLVDDQGGRLFMLSPGRTGTTWVEWAGLELEPSPDATHFEINCGACVSQDGTKVYVLKGHVNGGSQTLKCCVYNSAGVLQSTETVDASPDSAVTSQLVDGLVSARFLMVEASDGTVQAVYIGAKTADGSPIMYERSVGGAWSANTLTAPTMYYEESGSGHTASAWSLVDPIEQFNPMTLVNFNSNTYLIADGGTGSIANFDFWVFKYSSGSWSLLHTWATQWTGALDGSADLFYQVGVGGAAEVDGYLYFPLMTFDAPVTTQHGYLARMSPAEAFDDTYQNGDTIFGFSANTGWVTGVIPWGGKLAVGGYATPAFVPKVRITDPNYISWDLVTSSGGTIGVRDPYYGGQSLLMVPEP